jgi:hypothetical protein
MTTLIVLFNLKPEADVAAYERWAAEVDMATVRRLEHCDAFDVYRCTGTLAGGDAPYDYVEIIELSDLGGFRAEAAGDAVQQVAAQFREFADDPVFMITERLPA